MKYFGIDLLKRVVLKINYAARVKKAGWKAVATSFSHHSRAKRPAAATISQNQNGRETMEEPDLAAVGVRDGTTVVWVIWVTVVREGEEDVERGLPVEVVMVISLVEVVVDGAELEGVPEAELDPEFDPELEDVELGAVLVVVDEDEPEIAAEAFAFAAASVEVTFKLKEATSKVMLPAECQVSDPNWRIPMNASDSTRLLFVR